MYSVILKKENFKFSSSHFTIFNKDQAECLHGHNYKVEVEIFLEELDKKLGMAFDFNEIKPQIKNICDSLDEKILIPKLSSFLSIKNKNEAYTIGLGKKKYILPSEDVLELPVNNITSENLAEYFHKKLKIVLKIKSIKKIKVTILETEGQGASFEN